MFLKAINRIYEYVTKVKFISKSKKISHLIKKNLSKDQIFYIIDVGAGARYLRPVLNFDGSSKIFMIDPNDNLNVSVKNLTGIVKFKSSIIPIKTGIYKKNTTLNYYQANIPTSSSFIKYDKELKPQKKKVYNFSTLRKKYKINKIDILKIDIEGLELEVIKSILKFKNPLIIEIETNFKNSNFGDTFTPIHNFLSKKYNLETIFPSYQSSESNFNSHLKNFKRGTYASPIYRNQVSQMDCYYILNKKNYNYRDLLLLLGYGFVDMAVKKFNNIETQLSFDQRKNFLKIHKILND